MFLSIQWNQNCVVPKILQNIFSYKSYQFKKQQQHEGEKMTKPPLINEPVGLTAEVAEIDTAHLAALPRVTVAAQVAQNRAVHQQRLRENLVQRKMVSGQTIHTRWGQIHLRIALRAQDCWARVASVRVILWWASFPVHATLRERLALANAVRAERVQAGQDFRFSIHPTANTTDRAGLLPSVRITFTQACF